MRFLKDSPSGPISLSKLLCFVFLFVVAYDVWRVGFNAYNVAAFGLNMAAAFGRAMFGKWLDRNTFTSASTATTTVDVAKVAEVLSRRDAQRGIDPA